MNQTSALDNDLQKAIDDITKSTNMDPVFADPVATPNASSAPAAPAPKSPRPAPIKMPTPPPAPVINEPVVGPVNVPVMPPMPEMPKAPEMPAAPEAPEIPEEPIAEATTLEAITPAPMPNLGAMSPVEPAEPIEPETPVTGTTIEEVKITSAPADMKEVKQAALRDLAPILEKLDVNPEQKFGLYKNVISDLGDTSVVSPAYQAATNITDERERGEALLYLINTIDNL